MNYTHKYLLSIITAFTITLFTSSVAWSAESPDDIFMLKTTSNSISDVVKSVKAFAEKKHWIYLGDYKVKKGQVVLIKFCVKAAGKKAWKAGLKVSALLPCGSMGVYKKAGKTEISLLDPIFMTTLYPNPNLKEAADLLKPLYIEMLDTISK